MRVVLEHGEEYRDPDQPCDVYSCIVSILAWIYVISNDYVKCSTNLLWCHCNNNYVYFTGTWGENCDKEGNNNMCRPCWRVSRSWADTCPVSRTMLCWMPYVHVHHICNCYNRWIVTPYSWSLQAGINYSYIANPRPDVQELHVTLPNVLEGRQASLAAEYLANMFISAVYVEVIEVYTYSPSCMWKTVMWFETRSAHCTLSYWYICPLV